VSTEKFKATTVINA